MHCFSSWFHDNFASFGQDKLQNSGKEPKASSLIMENCSAHPDEELLISTDGPVMFIPPNISIINSAHGPACSGNLEVAIVENTYRGYDGEVSLQLGMYSIDKHYTHDLPYSSGPASVVRCSVAS